MINEEIEALRALSYNEYLKTEHWQRQRKGALQRAAYGCQVCKRSGVQLDVHHNTYERLGCEVPSDLFVLCNECHELFSVNGRLVDPDLDGFDEYEDDKEEWEADETNTALIEAQPGRLQRVLDHVGRHPRLDLTGGTLLLSFGVDIFIHFDPFGVIVGLAATAVVCWKSGDLVQGVMEMLIPGSNQDAVRESAEDFADRFLEDYPAYRDQSFGAKMHRLFHPFEEGEVVDVDPPKPKGERKIKSVPTMNTTDYERVVALWEQGHLNDTQFIALIECIENNANLSPVGESGESVKPPAKPGESGEGTVKFNGVSPELSPDVSPDDEQAIVRTAFALIAANGKVTREDIKAALGWNNKKHSLIKAVCDKYNIAMQGGR